MERGSPPLQEKFSKFAQKQRHFGLLFGSLSRVQILLHGSVALLVLLRIAVWTCSLQSAPGAPQVPSLLQSTNIAIVEPLNDVCGGAALSAQHTIQ